MNAKTTFAAALVALSTLAAAPAHAGGGFSIEFGGGHYGGGPHWGHHGGKPHWEHHGGPKWGHNRLSPQEVRWILRDRDYRQVNFIDRRGPTYQLTARKGGRDYYVVVNAFSGQIIHRHRI